MTVKPKTIDNLGIETSIRYAKDMELLDQKLVQESRLIPQKTEISALKPYVPSEFDQLFAPGKTMLWAAFAPPPDYFSVSRGFFSYQLVPSLGSFEKQEADAEKLASLEDVLKKPNARKKRDHGSDSDKEREEGEKERQVLVALLQTISKLDRTLTLINSRRNQYQRG